MSTLIAMLLSIYLVVSGQAAALYEYTGQIKILLGLVPMAGYLLLSSLLVGALQRVEKAQSPRVIEVAMDTAWLKLIGVYLFVFPIVSFAFLTNFREYNSFALGLWLVMFGLALDMLLFAKNIFWGFINPFSYIVTVQAQAKKALHRNRQNEIAQWIDVLAEQTNKSIANNAIALATASLNGLQGMIAPFLESSKGRLLNRDNDSGALEEITYNLSYYTQRLEDIFQKAIEKKSEPITSLVILLLGKTSIYAAKCDPGLALGPLNILGKLASQAQEKGLEEVAVKAAITLQQVGIAFTSDMNLFSLPLQEIFLTIIKNMELLSKNAFRKDKTINLELLANPFRQLKEQFLKGEQIAKHPDAPVILQELDRVIGEFEALGQVLANMTNIPGYSIPERGETLGNEAIP